MISDLWQFYMTANALQSLLKLAYRHQHEFQHLYVALCIHKWKVKRQSKIDQALRDFDDAWQIE